MTIALRTHATPATPWRQALPALLVLLGAVLVAYVDTFEAMVAIWSRSGTFAHAYLVPPIVLWLIWRQRDMLAPLQPKLCAWVLLPMAGAALAWLLGDLASVNSVTQLAATTMLLLAVPLVLGWQITRVILFPLLFLFFAVPIGEFLMPQLIEWTADFTVLALRASGIPVFREGTRFVIPSGSWSVVEACSGVRYLIASLMVGTLFAYLQYRTMWKRWVFAAFSLAVPIVANWIRAYLIVLLGHLSNNTLAVGVDHLIYGWLFFGLVVGVMFMLGMRWSELDAEPGPAPDGPGAVSADPVRPGRSEGFWAAAGAAAVLAIAPHVALQAIAEIEQGPPPELASLGNPAGGWQSRPGQVSTWKPAFQNPSAEATSSYVARDGRQVGLYLSYYRQQNFQRKLVSSDNELVKSKDPAWVMVGAAHGETVEIDGRSLGVRSALLQGVAAMGGPEQRLRVWQLYWVGGRLTSSDHWAKVLTVVDRLLGRGDDAAVIILYSAEDSSNGARAALESFARANLDSVVAQLQRTRDAVRTNLVTTTIESSAEGARK